MALFRNTSKQAKKDLRKIPETITPYYQPYIDRGTRSADTLESNYNDLVGGEDELQNTLHMLLTNPDAIIEMLGSGYQASPMYQREYDATEGAITNAQAAGGMAGSLQHQDLAGSQAQSLASQDINNYLKMALGLFGKGLSGSTDLYKTGLRGLEGFNEQGYRASDTLATDLAQELQSEANLDYAADIGHNRRIGAALGAGANFIGNQLHPRDRNAKAKSGGGGGTDKSALLASLMSLLA